jgi:hypothetical protein
MKGKQELPVLNRQLIVGEAKVAFEPIEKRRLKDSAASIKGIASQPNQFGPVKAACSSLIELLTKLTDVNQVGQTHADRTVQERKGSLRPWEALPDELEHQEFVKVSVQEGPRDRVQFPIMIVSAPSEINDHDRSTLAHTGCFGRLSVRRAVGRHAAGLHPCHHS